MMRSWFLASGLVIALVGAVRAQAPTPAPAPSAANNAAVVNGEPISMADLEATLKLDQPSPTPLTEAQRRQQRHEALSLLMDDLLLQQFLRKHAPKVDAAEVDKELAILEANLQKSKPGYTLKDFYAETGQTEAQVRTDLTHMLQWTAYVKGRVSDADVRRYYDDNKEFFDQVQVRASHIVIRLAGNVAETDVQTAKKTLLDLRQEITTGKIAFPDAAKKQSQCPSASGGGDIGYFSRKWMLDEAFAKAAFAMKVGDISDVVQTGYGLHLIQVTDRKPGQPSEYDKIKDDVRDMFVEEMRLSLLADLRKSAQIQVHLP